MNPLRLVISSVLFGSLALATSGSAQTLAGGKSAPVSGDEASNVHIVSAIEYADPGGISLLADIYQPKGKGPFPGIVFIHGGGWRNGDRNQLRRQAMYMAERGMVGMAIDYRLAPAHPFPAAIEDAKSAVLWFRKNAGKFDVDSTEIGLVGSSAGAHIAAMLGAESDRNVKKGTHVQAVVAFNGIFDFEQMPQSTMVSDFLGSTCEKNPMLCRQASPIDHLTKACPPFLILHGTADQTAPFAQAEAFVGKLKQSGQDVIFFEAEAAPHTFWAQPKWISSSFDEMAKFLTSRLASAYLDNDRRRVNRAR